MKPKPLFKLLKIKNISFLLLSALFLLPSLVQVYAQTPTPAPLVGTISNPLTAWPGGFPQATILLSNIIRLITAVAGIYAFVNFILAGVSFISSGGNPETISNAWKRIYMSIIGLSVVILSYAFAALLGWMLYGDTSAILRPTIYGP